MGNLTSSPPATGIQRCRLAGSNQSGKSADLACAYGRSIPVGRLLSPLEARPMYELLLFSLMQQRERLKNWNFPLPFSWKNQEGTRRAYLVLRAQKARSMEEHVRKAEKDEQLSFKKNKINNKTCYKTKSNYFRKDNFFIWTCEPTRIK